MLGLDKIQRSRLDHLLVETIKQVGVSNYSLIARLTGLNAETVRYKVNRQLNRMGLSVHVNIDFEGLGFKRGIFLVKASANPGRSWIDHASYLTFVGKIMGLDRYICTYAVPYRLKKKYLDSFDSLKQSGLVEEFVSLDVSWVRYPSFRSEFYDYDKRCWLVDWNRVDMTLREVGASSGLVDRDATVDYIDLRILRAMQEDPTCSIAKTAKEMNANPRTVRYHYSEHVLKGHYVLGHSVRWARPTPEGKQADLMQLVFSFRDLKQEEMNLARKVFNKIPFTWLEVGTEDNRYFAFLDISLTNFHETVRFVERNTEPIRDRLEMTTLDPPKTYSINIPDEMFDRERGWGLMPTQRSVAEVSKVDGN
ncbi:MAG: winged helix-turn-helix domain-containing protein [Thaumarchaeota archaeon]|nr:winged helix-turn-helix domain-containing protein [Nitrososphaerota archaeon]